MTYAVKTLENLFTWCGHERYLMMMEINQSKNHTLKVTNVVMYCDARTDVHIHTQTLIQEKKLCTLKQQDRATETGTNTSDT